MLIGTRNLQTVTWHHRVVLSAIVIAMPEAAAVVDGWREQTCSDRPSIGIPPHVTLLFPFMPAEQIDETVLAPLRALFTAASPFQVVFRELRRWPGMAYLAPEPPGPFVGLTEAIVERWPDYPPYEGVHEAVIPHLTVAYGDDGLLAEVGAEVTPRLPIEARVAEALLLQEIEPNWGRWDERARFLLRQSAA
jgi:2'-5' RNA ligase